MLGATLKVEILQEGVHSGHARFLPHIILTLGRIFVYLFISIISGIVPSSFRILRNILTRLEDPKTGKVDKMFHVDISKQVRAQAKEAANVLGPSIFEEVLPPILFPFCYFSLKNQQS
jgi:hypothetical protein